MKFYKTTILIILIHYLSSSEIIYEFKRDFELNETMSEESIYLKLSYNDIYTFVKLGTPLKELKVGITFKSKSLAILGSNIKDKNIFDETKSSSYNSISKLFCYESQILDANISEEYIYLNNINKNEKIKFVLITELGEESLIRNPYEPIYFSGYIGLAINKQFENDFPDSLPLYLNENCKDKYSSAFFVKFNIKEPGNYNGKLVLNGYPHEYDKKNYNIKQYKSTRIQSINNINDWCISIDNAYYGKNSIIQNNYIIFSIEFGIILAPNDFMKHLSDNYFEKYSDKCEYKTLKLMYDDYKYYVCSKGIDITKMQNISFELKENNFNFTLDYKDLFYEYNNKYYFLISTRTSSSSLHDFIIGSVLMKKYDFVFDKFKSNIGFYDLSIKVDDEKNYFIIFIMVISALSLLIILLIIYFVWKYFNKPRNSRKNELNDDYNYISSINPEGKDQ